MPVVINEIEVVEQPQPQPGPAIGAPPPLPAPPLGDAVLALVRDAHERQRRRVAD